MYIHTCKLAWSLGTTTIDPAASFQVIDCFLWSNEDGWMLGGMLF